MSKKLLSQRHPILYFIAIWEKRIRRSIRWKVDSKTYTSETSTERYPYRIKKHQSRLMRRLGDTEMWMQVNKVKNLEIAIKTSMALSSNLTKLFPFVKR